MLERLGRFDEAAAAFRAVIRLVPSEANVWYRLGRALTRAKEYSAAERALAHASELAPERTGIILANAKLKILQGQPEFALAVAKDLMGHEKEMVAGEILAGQAFLAMGDVAKAIASFERVKEADVSGHAVLALLQAYRIAGNREAGFRVANEWLANHPNNTVVRIALANTYQADDLVDEAIDNYERALKSSRRSLPLALNNLALLYHLIDDPRALATAESALAIAPDDARIQDTVGWLLLRTDNTERALVLLRAAARELPRNPTVRFHLASGYARSGDLAKAEKYLREALALGNFAKRAQAELLLSRLQ